MSVKLINLKKALITLSLSIDTLYRFSSMAISLDNAVCSCTAFLSQSNKSNDTQSWLSKLNIPLHFIMSIFNIAVTAAFLPNFNVFTNPKYCDQYTFLCRIFFRHNCFTVYTFLLCGFKDYIIIESFLEKFNRYFKG